MKSERENCLKWVWKLWFDTKISSLKEKKKKVTSEKPTCNLEYSGFYIYIYGFYKIRTNKKG